MFFNMFSSKYQESVVAALQDVEGATRASLIRLRDNPRDPDSLYTAGSLFACQGKWWEAVYYLEQDVLLSPNDASLLNDLSNCYWNQGALEKCLDVLHKLLSLNPASWLTYDKLGVVSGELGRWEDAVFYGEEAVRRGGFRFPESLGNLARAYISLKRYEDATPLLHRALRDDPENSDLKNLLARALAGEEHPNAGDPISTERLTRALSDASPHLEVAARLQAEGELEQAIAELRHALRVEPRNGEVLRQLAILFFHTKQYPESISSFIHAEARCAVLDAENLLLLGRAYAAMSFHHKALESYNRSLLLAQDANTHFACGDSYLKLQDFDSAARCFERALALDPDHPDALYSLAAVHAEQGDFVRALLAYERWIGTQSRYASTNHSAAISHLRRKDYARAFDLIAALQQENAQDAEAFFLEGCIHAEQSRPERAIAALEMCLRFDTHHPLALALLITLKHG